MRARGRRQDDICTRKRTHARSPEVSSVWTVSLPLADSRFTYLLTSGGIQVCAWLCQATFLPVGREVKWKTAFCVTQDVQSRVTRSLGRGSGKSTFPPRQLLRSVCECACEFTTWWHHTSEEVGYRGVADDRKARLKRAKANKFVGGRPRIEWKFTEDIKQQPVRGWESSRGDSTRHNSDMFRWKKKSVNLLSASNGALSGLGGSSYISYSLGDLTEGKVRIASVGVQCPQGSCSPRGRRNVLLCFVNMCATQHHDTVPHSFRFKCLHPSLVSICVLKRRKLTWTKKSTDCDHRVGCSHSLHCVPVIVVVTGHNVVHKLSSAVSHFTFVSLSL